MNVREFGVRLTKLRERAGLSVTQLAHGVRIDYMQISRYEKGASLPSLANAVTIARFLRITLDELVTGAEPERANPPAFQNARLYDRMRELDQIPPARQEMALRILDTVITGHELEGLSDRLRRK